MKRIFILICFTVFSLAWDNVYAQCNPGETLSSFTVDMTGAEGDTPFTLIPEEIYANPNGELGTVVSVTFNDLEITTQGASWCSEIQIVMQNTVLFTTTTAPSTPCILTIFGTVDLLAAQLEFDLDCAASVQIEWADSFDDAGIDYIVTGGSITFTYCTDGSTVDLSASATDAECGESNGTITATSSVVTDFNLTGPVNDSNMTGIFENVPPGEYTVTGVCSNANHPQAVAPLLDGVLSADVEVGVSFGDFAGAMSCNDLVQVSLDEDCAAVITPDMILEGLDDCHQAFSVNIEGVVGDIVESPGLYTVTVTGPNGNTCWGKILVEDNLDPVLEDCPCENNQVVSFTPFPDNIISGTLADQGDNYTNLDACAGNLCTPDDLATIGGPNHEYDLVSFQVDVDGIYDFNMDGFDGWSGIYTDFFDPSDPCPGGTNFVACDDDNDNGSGNVSIFEPYIDDVELFAGVDYVLVTSNWAAGTTGPYSYEVTGPGNVGLLDVTGDEPCVINCLEVDWLINNDNYTDDLGWNPTWSDNCEDYSTTFSDEWIEGNDCGTGYIVRTWFITTTNHGQTVTEPAGCVQYFQIEPLTHVDVWFPPDITLDCGSDVSMPYIANFFDMDGRGIYIDPEFGCIGPVLPGFNYPDLDTRNNDGYAYAYPHVIGSCGEIYPIWPTMCNLASSKTDQIIPDCGEGDNQSRKVIRLWTVLDWCTGETWFDSQIIKAIDETPPVIELDDEDILVATDPWVCGVDVTLPLPEHLYDNCYGAVAYYVSIPGIMNDPWNRPFSDTKNPASPYYWPDDQIDGDMNSGYIIRTAPKGTHIVTYTAKDQCDNQATATLTLNVVDETPPVAVAKQNIVISLTSASTSGEGFAKLYAVDVDNGSHDNCTDVGFEIRREEPETCSASLSGCGIVGNNTFSNKSNQSPYCLADPDGGQYVKFCCDDVYNNDGLVRVVLRVWDDANMNGVFGDLGADNYNDTWAWVKVEDKLPPAIQCPDDITLDCDEDVHNYAVTGKAYAFGTCGPREVVSSDISDTRDQCGVGQIRRRWFVAALGQDGEPQTDANGNFVADPNAPFCDQIITVLAVDPFEYNDIDWPSDMDLVCGIPDAGEPEWNNVPCSLVGSSVESQVFEFEDGACYKELNHWTVIDWCQYNAATGAGIWSDTQIIKVDDESKPEVECPDRLEWATEDCRAQDVILTNTATDDGSDCPSDWLKWEVCLDLYYDWSCDYIWTSDEGYALQSFTDNVFYIPASGNGDEVSIPVTGEFNPGQPEELDLKVGDHRVNWTVADGCGNVTSCDQLIVVEDGKAPTPYCIQNLSTAVMDHGGTVTIWAVDFNLDSGDNCTAKEDLVYSFADGAASKTFTCDDMIVDGDTLTTRVFDLEMHVEDEAGNSDFCFVQLRVNDNGVCKEGGEDDRATVSGLVTTETGDMVSQTSVSLNSSLPEFPITQVVDGEYTFIQNPMYFNYEVTAEKNDYFLNGVSTLDLVKIQQHILGLQLLNSPYKAIAADVNSDESISALDLVELRKLILGIIAEYSNNNSWRFVDASQSFDDVNDPWPFTEILSIEDLSEDMMTEDFVASKIGDVSGDAQANFTSGSAEIRGNASLDMMTEDRSYAAGEMVRLDISSENFTDIYGYQFTLNYSGLEYVGIEAGALDVTSDNFGLHRTKEGMISTSWASSEAVSSNEVLFSVLFTATVNGQLSESISIGSAITKAEAYRSASLSVENVSIEFRTDNGSLSGTEFALYQNEPNPFASTTLIGFELPQAAQATITVYDVTGKVVKIVRGDYERGYNEVNLERNELNSAGVLYYQLESGEFTATKKMILID